MSFQLKNFNELSNQQMYKILQQRTQVFVVEQNCPYLEVDGKDEASLHLFKEVDGVIAAYCRLLPPGISYEEASIGRVLVHESFRGQGLAETMMKQAIQYIVETMQQPTIKIQAQSYLEKFYSSLGFEKISEEYLEDNIPHIDMRLKK